jgi:hypothetical protein
MDVPPDERTDRRGPDLRPLGLALAVLAMLAIVALASRGRVPGGGGGTQAIHTDLVLEYVLLFFLVLAFTVAPFMAHAIWTAKRSRTTTLRRSNWMGRTFLWMSVLALIAAVVLLMRSRRGSGQRAQTVPTSTLVTTAPATTSDERKRNLRFDWVPVFVVSGLFVAAATAGFLLYRQNKRRRPKTADDLALELSHVLDDTLDDLRADPDPRRAVIRAYARMERALAWFGLPRRAHEAPLEYLARVLLELHASAESVTRLTGLFERAKFSHHEIGKQLKADAVEALETVRDELRGYR